MLQSATRLSKILGILRTGPLRTGRARPRFRVVSEGLEPRHLLSGLGTDYTLMGGQWDNSTAITYSVAPDGVNWDQGTNHVNASLDAEYGGNSWHGLIDRALQTWAAATNLNFSPVSDGLFDFNASGINQGDPSFGDIRIGGYNFGNTAVIARTYGPPPNGETGAGDVELNTGFNFAASSHYDLESVLIHELGHSLGLGESPQPTSVMYSYYAGVRQSLSSYDIEGIQSIYGARSPDVYQAQGLADSAASALDLTPTLNGFGQGQLAGLSLQTIGDTEYFSVVAPQVTGATLDVAAIARGFSLLSPKISVIDPSTGATLAADANPAAHGNIALGSVPGVQAGHRYLIAVTGATGDVFSVGSYGIQLGFFGGTPIVPPPDGYAYNNMFANPTDLGVDAQATIGNLTLPSALNYQLFSFETSRAGLVLVGTLGADAIVGDSSGNVVADGSGLIGFHSPGVGRYFLILRSPDGAPVGNYAFAVRTPTAPPSSPGAFAIPAVSATVEIESTDASPTNPDAEVHDAITPAVPRKKPSRPVG